MTATKNSCNAKRLTEKRTAMTPNKTQPHVLTVAERHAAALMMVYCFIRLSQQDRSISTRCLEKEDSEET